jgi:hypothetical protein
LWSWRCFGRQSAELETFLFLQTLRTIESPSGWATEKTDHFWNWNTVRIIGVLLVDWNFCWKDVLPLRW